MPRKGLSNSLKLMMKDEGGFLNLENDGKTELSTLGDNRE